MKKGLVMALGVLAVAAGVAVAVLVNNTAGIAVSPGTETSAQLAANTPKTETTSATDSVPEAPVVETVSSTPEAPVAPVTEATPAPETTTTAAAPASETPTAPSVGTIEAASSTPPAGITPAGITPSATATPDADVPEIDMAAASAERTLGKDDAPVTVIEYASLSCDHCAFFSKTLFAELKTKLIDTGKIKFIFRDFPLDQYALRAAKMARCAPVDKYFDLVEVIYRNQSQWRDSKDPDAGLMQLGALTGMGDTYMKNCMGSVELESVILRGVAEGQTKFQVKATPTFVFNYGADSFAGAQEIAKFEEIVKRLTPAGK